MDKWYCVPIVIIGLAVIALSLTDMFNYISFKNKSVELEERLERLEKEVEFNKDTTDRQIDTCIDILVNRRWD